MLAYFPSYQILKQSLGREIKSLSDTETVQVSASVLKLLIRSALEAAPFDEQVYLATNLDLREAWEKGEISDLHRHYVEAGYLEGRQAEPRQIDEEWYLAHYKDVAAAVREGTVQSAQAHFDLAGEREWRAPNSNAGQQMQEWRTALLSI